MAVRYKGLGYVTVVAAGTPVVLNATELMTSAVMIQGAVTNVGAIYVGGSDLDATHRGAEIGPGVGLLITGDDVRGIAEEFSLSEIKVDAANSGDKVVVSYFARRN